MIEMSDFKKSSNKRGGDGIRISIDDDEGDTEYENDKKRKGGPSYTAFNETRQKTQDSDPSVHLDVHSPDQEDIH